MITIENPLDNTNNPILDVEFSRPTTGLDMGVGQIDPDKTGAMKLGRDAIVLTQTAESRSISFLSQSFNDGKSNVEVPIVSYCRRGSVIDLDTSVQSKDFANYHLAAIKEFSPFD
ncbi:hypothetical protein GIB67_015633 [Kingdonia uniflora]|uniref:Uncharacterized protein n=1 Tax=Kingdonia uniflora TaxID=39325 RepID=A0A7J7NU31_9MAGN|nr:hypothetical protein GIB67_015633 [Kingdonia uniflora]